MKGLRRRLLAFAPAVALVLLALCLRGPFSAVGPVADDLRSELSLSTAALGVLTGLPLVCFGLVSPVAPALAFRWGEHRAVLAAAVAIVAGIVLRTAWTPGMFAGTVLLTSGIAVANVLLPAVARAEYADRSAVAVGAVACSMALSASFGAGLAQPLTHAAGSARGGLLLWVVLALVATAAVALLTRARPRTAPVLRAARRAILHDRVARLVTVFFGLQSLVFYAMLAWLPDVLQRESGLSAVAAGGLLGVATALGAPASLFVPVLAARRPGQGLWVLAAGLLMGGGLAGLLLAPHEAPAVWTVAFGLGTGVAFPLAVTLLVLRTRDVEQTGRLSAAAQSTGYLLAATGPIGVGLLHDLTGGWTGGLLVLVALVVLQTVVGLGAARPRFVTEHGPDGSAVIHASATATR